MVNSYICFFFFPKNTHTHIKEVGAATKSYVSTVLEEDTSRLNADDIRDLKCSASSLYGGGADTTVSAEYAFYLAMVLFPGIFIYMLLTISFHSFIDHHFFLSLCLFKKRYR